MRLTVRPITAQVFQRRGRRFSFISLAHQISLLRIRWGEGGRRPDEVFFASGEGGRSPGEKGNDNEPEMGRATFGDGKLDPRFEPARSLEKTGEFKK